MNAIQFIKEHGVDKAREVVEVRAMDNFEEWFQSQDFYTNLRFIHGDALFLKDGDVYRVLVVRTASKAWQEQQKRVEEQAKEINFLNNRADDLALDQMKTAQFNYQLEQKINDLQAQLDEVNASNLRRSVHIDRLQKHNLKLQQRLKENGLEWKDLIEEQALKGGED